MPGKDIAVLGAGAVGVSIALYLQRDGHRVTLIDRDEPGMGCSYGNAALIQCSSVLPVAAPDVLRQVPKLLFDPDQPLVIRWRHLPTLIPFLLAFMRESRPSRYAANADALAAIVPQSFDAYEPLIEAAGLQDLVRRKGELQVFQSHDLFKATAPGRRMREERGVKVELLGEGDLRAIEPALAPDCRWGVMLPSSYQVSDPYRLVSGLARHFAAQGGTIAKAAVRDVLPLAGGGFRIDCEGAEFRAARVVVAMGAFSGPLTRRLGSRTPLNSERGYHAMLPEPGVGLDHTLISADYRFAIAPVDGGIRLAGTAELARVGAPPNYDRARRLIPLAQKVLPGLKADNPSYWMGHRPSLPDSVPVIGPSPHHDGLYFAFGHGHSGLTLGGMTGRMIAGMVGARRSNLDLTPYSITRFP